jgi:hypothetical protein
VASGHTKHATGAMKTRATPKARCMSAWPLRSSRTVRAR